MKKPTRQAWLRVMLKTKVGPLPPTALTFSNPFTFNTPKPFQAPRSLAIAEKANADVQV